MSNFKFVNASTQWFNVIRDGSDLGSSFDHIDGYLYFLFGDTPSLGENPDVVGRTDAVFPDDHGLMVDVNDPHPWILRIEGIGQREFEVPTGGFSLHDRMYVFFTSDHYRDDQDHDKMGQCVLASAKQITDVFGVVVDVDRMPERGHGGVGHFINVCPRIIRSGEHPELPDYLTDGVMMWGSGDYRESNVYLAFAPMNEIGRPDRWLYYAGDSPLGSWRSEPEAAVPLLDNSRDFVGELSVAFIPGLGQWIMLYGGALNPIRACCSMAPNPWGPWRNLPLPSHADERHLEQGCLYLDGDDRDGVYRLNGGFGQPNVGPYAFYIIERYTRWDPAAAQATLWFTASENDMRGSRIYRTHLVRSVLQFEPLTLPQVRIDVVPDTIRAGEDATATISLFEPFRWDLEIDGVVYYPDAARVRVDPTKTSIKAGDTAAMLHVTTEEAENFKKYTAQIEASYIAPQLEAPRATADGHIDIKPTHDVGILGAISLSSRTVSAGATVHAYVYLEGPVAVPTDVSVGAFDPPGIVVQGQTDVVTLSTNVVTIPANTTIGQFEIRANTNVLSAREVIIIASAVVEKRAHLTVERR